jgi:DNA-binding beta-propeller fold protein YncE
MSHAFTCMIHAFTFISFVLFAGTITTVSGGIRGLQDGSTEGAKFSWPYGVALAPDANTLYVADSGNDCVRAVSLSEGARFIFHRKYTGVHPIIRSEKKKNRSVHVITPPVLSLMSV